MINNYLNKARNHNMRYKTKRFQCYFVALFPVQSSVVADSLSLAFRFDFIPPAVTRHQTTSSPSLT